MAEAKIDENFVATIIGVSSVDGETPVNVSVNPVTLAVIVEVT